MGAHPNRHTGIKLPSSGPVSPESKNHAGEAEAKLHALGSHWRPSVIRSGTGGVAPRPWACDESKLCLVVAAERF